VKPKRAWPKKIAAFRPRAEPEFNPLQDFVSVDLVSVARDASAHWIPQALATGVDFELDAPEHAVTIQGNVTLLGELVSNLVDNAVRYGAKPGNVKVTVCDDPVPSITVEDDGRIFAPVRRRKLFSFPSASAHAADTAR
jgi:Signal transduction histidine kinase